MIDGLVLLEPRSDFLEISLEKSEERRAMPIAFDEENKEKVRAMVQRILTAPPAAEEDKNTGIPRDV